MGYMRHHAIVITGWSYDEIDEAFRKAGQLGMTKTPIVESPVNAYWSFLIVPDGSKEGWSASQEGDESRDEFIAWLTEIEDGIGLRKRYYLDWAEVIYGDEDGPARVQRSSDHNEVA